MYKVAYGAISKPYLSHKEVDRFLSDMLRQKDKSVTDEPFAHLKADKKGPMDNKQITEPFAHLKA